MTLNKQLKIGFGIGCGFLVVVFLLVVGGGTYWATNTGRDFKAVIKVEKNLNQEYGVLGAYAPVDGGLPAQERIETFIAVRKSLVEYHAGMAIALEDYIAQKESNSGEGIMDVINSVRAGSRLGPAYALFWLARNEKLLEYGMGAGEYAYIYCLAYYGHLNHDPGDGVTGLDGISTSDAMVNVRVVAFEDDRELNATEKARKRTSKMMVGFLEKVEIANRDNMPPELAGWLGELETEITNLQNDPFLIPFQDNGNETLAKVFDKYRVELEGTYVSRVNPLELFFQQEKEKEKEKEEEEKSSDEN